RRAGAARRRRSARGRAAAADRRPRRAQTPRRRRPRRHVSDLAGAGRAFRRRAGPTRMSGFSAEWLALREPYDRAARNPTVLDAVAGAFGGDGAIAVVDLARGTGATLRAIGPRLPPRQAWRLVDNDLGLLAHTPEPAQPVTVVARPLDLVRDLELALEGPLDLIVTSALLDLVSGEWLERLVIGAGARRLPVYAALTYDGRAVIEPSEPFDRELVAGFNLHQRTDKGFGAALGPTAAARAIERFEHLGYSVVQGRSD